MSGHDYTPRCFVALLSLLSIVGVGSGASAFTFIALDFGNATGSTPPSQVFSIDSETGAATPIGFASVNRLNELAMSPSGELITKRQDIGLLELDPSTGMTTFWAASPPNTYDSAMAFAASGDLFLTGPRSTSNTSDGHGLYRYDPATAQSSFVGNIRFTPSALVFGPDGTLYGWDIFEGLIRIDPSTGLGVDLDPLVGPRNGTVLDRVAQALAFGPDGRLFGAWESLYEIDIAAGGTYTQIGGSYADIRGMVALVPEPGTLPLVAGGLLSVALRRRRVR